MSDKYFPANTCVLACSGPSLNTVDPFSLGLPVVVVSTAIRKITKPHFWIIADYLKEKAILEEKRAEREEQQNAEIITKLSNLNESLNNLEVGGGSRGGSGSFIMGAIRSLGGLLSSLVSSILPLVMSGITSIAATLGTLFSAVLPVLLPIITTALAGLAGYALFKLVIEPYMEDAAKRIQDKILKSTIS